MSENDTTIEDMIAKQRIINEMVANFEACGECPECTPDED